MRDEDKTKEQLLAELAELRRRLDQDIDELKRAEEKVAEERNRLASIVEHSDNAIISVSLEGRVLTWNQGARRLFGYGSEEAKDKSISTLVPLEQSELLSASLAQIRQGRAAAHLEAIPLVQYEAQVYVSITVSPVKGADGQLIGASLIGRDVTEQVHSQEVQEREMRTWEGLSSPIQAVVTAEAFGLSPLSKSKPQFFAEMIRRYEQALENAWEKQVYRVKYAVSDELRTIAEYLGRAGAGPRDVVKIHTIALKNKGRDVPIPKAQAYAEEGRLLIVELMGYLTSYYRNYFLTTEKNRRADRHRKENFYG